MTKDVASDCDVPQSNMSRPTEGFFFFFWSADRTGLTRSVKTQKRHFLDSVSRSDVAYIASLRLANHVIGLRGNFRLFQEKERITHAFRSDTFRSFPSSVTCIWICRPGIRSNDLCIRAATSDLPLLFRLGREKQESNPD